MYVAMHYFLQSATIKKMFEVISEKLKIPVDQLRVVVANHCIDQKSQGTLEDYNIDDNTTVHIVQRVHGGNEPDKAKCCLTRVEFPMEELTKMSCGHAFSPDALIYYLDDIVSKNTKLICPVCKKNWKQAEISSSGLTEQKIQEILESIATNLMFSLYNCKRCPQCDTLTERINEDCLRTECLICSQKEKYEFCWSCMEKWKNVSTKKVCGNEDCDPTNKDIIDQLETCNVKEMSGIKNVPAMRACPECGMGISHTHGCKYMVCTICKTDFCFACLSIKDKEKKIWPASCGSWNTQCEVTPRQKKLPEKKKKYN